MDTFVPSDACTTCPGQNTLSTKTSSTLKLNKDLCAPTLMLGASDPEAARRASRVRQRLGRGSKGHRHHRDREYVVGRARLWRDVVPRHSLSEEVRSPPTVIKSFGVE
jgi:hypothetical protein